MADAADSAGPVVQQGMSPYATGGGGVTFERKVAVQYLVRMLGGVGCREVGDGRVVVAVDFQQAPGFSADDLVVRARSAQDGIPALALAVAVRRKPKLIPSSAETQKLVGSLLRQTNSEVTDGSEVRVALVVAGHQDHAAQLAVLADHASTQRTSAEYFELIRSPSKFDTRVVKRLGYIEKLVKAALIDQGEAEPSEALVAEQTFRLLDKLTVLMPRLESPDETDWAAIVSDLTVCVANHDMSLATGLRDRLLALADDFGPKAATLDRNRIRGMVFGLFDQSVGRLAGWRKLESLSAQARSVVGLELRSGDGQRQFRVDQAEQAQAIFEDAQSGRALLVHGESGVGKSALVVHGVVAAADQAGDVETVLVNLRQLPTLPVDLESALDAGLAELLLQVGAPRRLLVIDAADAALEQHSQMLVYLLGAAAASDFHVIVVSAPEGLRLLSDTLAKHLCSEVQRHRVEPLSDDQVNSVIAAFPELSGFSSSSRSKDLLRRLVVADLLVRGGLSGVPLTSASAMEQVWSHLVRRNEATDRGMPAARDTVMLQIARHQLEGGDALDLSASLDAMALDGLCRDGLLRVAAPEDPFGLAPQFAHDEIRRYATARLLLAGADPTVRLLAAGAPRWSLGAARLACEALLQMPDVGTNPQAGRLMRIQNAFDGLIEQGSARWGDVPSEALLSIPDPLPLLSDAWSVLRADDAGIERLSRIIDQHFRNTTRLVRAEIAEPLVRQILTADSGWFTHKASRELVRDYLQALCFRGAPAGNDLRITVRDCLLQLCAEADRAHDAEVAARAAAPRQKGTPRGPLPVGLLTEIGYPRRRRHNRRDIPREITDEAMVELLALLGPDLSLAGEATLRRLGDDAPNWLMPAVESTLAPRSLMQWSSDLLADLAEAYYVDPDDEYGFGLHRYGIRDHHFGGLGTPMSAAYRGPFLDLLAADPIRAITVINKMLNRAAHERARVMATPYQGFSAQEDVLDEYRVELSITGQPHTYEGDDQTWRWYRGTGVGPYPCMSALQALEVQCDRFIQGGVPVEHLVARLLNDCDSLAMVGLVVGLIVRHLRVTDRLLDPYLAEPDVWTLEFLRLTHEYSGLKASSEGLVAPERRNWSLREAASWLVVYADAHRAEELKKVGIQLLERAADGGESDVPAFMRGWASGLDQQTYKVVTGDDGAHYVQSTPPADVIAELAAGNGDVQLGQQATDLVVRYHISPELDLPPEVASEKLLADLVTARQLIETPPSLYGPDRPDAPVMVVAAVLEAWAAGELDVPDEDLAFCVMTVLNVAERMGSSAPLDSEDAFFEQGADRTVARVFSLLLDPAANHLVALIEPIQATGDAMGRVLAAGMALANSLPNETRMNLARGFDRLWKTPCRDDHECHHKTAMTLVEETMRECVMGPWNEYGERSRVSLDPPLAQSLAVVSDKDVYFPRLDAAIRAAAPAVTANVCISTHAADLLEAMLTAQGRSLATAEHDYDDRATHTLVAARALLIQYGESGTSRPIFDFADRYVNRPQLLTRFIRSLTAAGQESARLAAAAEQLWPDLIQHVMGVVDAHPALLQDERFPDPLSVLLPAGSTDETFLYRELGGDPIIWWDPIALEPHLSAWRIRARGRATCVDQFISYVTHLPASVKVSFALPWVAELVLADPVVISKGSYLVESWLIELRQAALTPGEAAVWQRVVDALVVAGRDGLAPYSD